MCVKSPAISKIRQCSSGSKKEERKTTSVKPLYHLWSPSFFPQGDDPWRKKGRGSRSVGIAFAAAGVRKRPSTTVMLTWQRSATYAVLLAPFCPTHHALSVCPTNVRTYNEWMKVHVELRKGCEWMKKKTQGTFCNWFMCMCHYFNTQQFFKGEVAVIIDEL